MAQTSHPRKQAAAVRGQLSDSTVLKHIDSLRNDNSSAEIAFGLMVGASATAGGAVTIDATDDALVGVVVRDQAYDVPNEHGDTGLKADVVMGVLSRGRIWVPVEETISDLSGPVRVRAVATGAEEAGAFRTTADGTDCIDISAMARWITGGSTIAEVEIDMLQASAAVAD